MTPCSPDTCHTCPLRLSACLSLVSVGSAVAHPQDADCGSWQSYNGRIMQLSSERPPCRKAQQHTHIFNGPLSRTTRVSRYQKVKPIWILLKQETVSGSGISWAKCKSAPRSRQITMPAPHHSVFYRPDALPATQPTASKQSKCNDLQGQEQGLGNKANDMTFKANNNNNDRLTALDPGQPG